MMGFGYVTPTAGRNSGSTTDDTVMVVLMGLLFALVIDQQEFDRRRQALGGTA